VYYTIAGETVYFPSVGGFEVYLGDSKIFSKLETKKWPTPELIVTLAKTNQKESAEDKQIRLS
jgi:hypothetical protein